MVLLAELMAHPPTERRAGFAKIDGDIEYLPPHHADECSLRLPDLIMQAPKHTAAGPRMVILDKLHIQFNLIPERMRVPGFQKVTSVVLEHARLQEQNVRDFRADH